MGSLDGFAGSEVAVGSFDNINELIGSAAAGDSLTGLNAGATWKLGSSTQYVSTRTLDFSGFEALLGGSGADTFQLQNGVTFAGTVNGGAGSDKLDYSAYGNSVTVDLGAGTASGLNGFSSIESVLGSSLGDNPDRHERQRYLQPDLGRQRHA